MIVLRVKKRIIIASGKGGVGKSTLSSHLALALSRLGKRVLLIDCDFENRCLDIIFSLEDSVTFDLGDVIANRIAPKEAVKNISDNLFFVPAPPPGAYDVSLCDPAPALNLITEYVDPDYVIYDTGAGTRVPLILARNCADSAVIVATQSPMSVRAADSVGDILFSEGITDLSLVIQNFHIKEAAKGTLDGITSMIDKTRLRLIGVVPYSHSTAVAGISVTGKYDDISCAADNIAARITGYSVPLFTSMKAARGRSKTYK